MRKLFKIGVEDHEKGDVIFSWQPDGNLLATAGRNCLVHIFDRHGERVDEISLSGTGRVISLAWDHEGESLAVLQEGNAIIPIWDQGSKAVLSVDTNLKDPTFMAWSRVGPQLAIGTAKGNLLLYNKRTRKKIPVLGKHPRKITCGAWSRSNQLALGSEDKTLTLSNDVGDTLAQTELKLAALQMAFAVQKRGGSSSSSAANSTTGSPSAAEEPDNCISIVMGGKSLLLYSLTDPDNPIELAFLPKYGDVVCHRWFGDGFVLLGFSEGYLVIVSTHAKEMGEEQFSGKFFVGALTELACTDVLRRAATAGEGGVKILDLTTYKELHSEAVSIDSAVDGRVCGLAWSPDGQILTVATKAGVVFNFLARMPTVHAAHGAHVAYLSSLREITIADCSPAALAAERPRPPTIIPVALEPSFVALGDSHVAVGMNSTALFYRRAGGGEVGGQQEYPGAVEELCLNSRYAAVLFGSQIVLHPIERAASNDASEQLISRRTFPAREDSSGAQGHATAVALTEALLIYGTRSGTVEFFYLPDGGCALSGATLRHAHPVRRIAPNHLGTRVLLCDNAGEGLFYSPATGELTPAGGFPGGVVSRVMWDHVDRNVVAVCDGASLHMWVFTALSLKGAAAFKLGVAEVDDEGALVVTPRAWSLPGQHSPVIMANGQVTCQQGSGTLGTVTAGQYDGVSGPGAVTVSSSVAAQKEAFCQNLALLRLKGAWRGALRLDDRNHFLALANRAMEVLDVAMAIQVYRQLGDAGMVLGLERVSHVEDKNLLAGNIALLFGDYQTAQDLFLSSSRPVAALEMQRDLLHWDQALKLATTLAPQAVPEMSAEYAQQLEFKGENEAALAMYEQALAGFSSDNTNTNSSSSSSKRRSSSISDYAAESKFELTTTVSYNNISSSTASSSVHSKQQKSCTAGIARCTLRLGDLHRGLTLARSADDQTLYRDAAEILEQMRQPGEAAAMWERGAQYERALALHVAGKNMSAAAAVVGRVTLPKLLGVYARACEAQGNWAAAAEAHERARDMDAVARLCLEQLNQPERAFAIVRATASSAGAELVSKYCAAAQDWRGAIEFLLMAQRHDEAFALAKAHSEMESYTGVRGDALAADDALRVAKYYETQRDLGSAGRFYALCGQHHRALKLFLQCGESEIASAIAVVGKARSDMLTHTLIDYLMGETDGVPKDPNYIYRLYLALGNFQQAAKTAVIIARQEQDLGNYKEAHAILFETLRQLEDQRAHVPQALRRSFILLHSYTLVKRLAKRGDHEGAARMLLRVAKSISKFPTHTVPVLTSTVIECQRAGLRNSAFEYATMLMRQEYRGQLDKKYRRNIEVIVRRPNREEEPEPVTPCPISGQPLPTTALECPTTKDALPMCVVTGRHMERGDWCVCPVSRMPALLSEYVRALQWEHTHKGAAAATNNENDEGDGEEDPATNGRKGSVGGASPVTTATGGSNWLGTDPVLGQRVCSEQLRRCSSEEVDEQIKAYNQSEQDEKAESGASGGANGNSSSGAGGTEGPGSPPASRPKAKQAYG